MTSVTCAPSATYRAMVAPLRCLVVRVGVHEQHPAVGQVMRQGRSLRARRETLQLASGCDRAHDRLLPPLWPRARPGSRSASRATSRCRPTGRRSGTSARLTASRAPASCGSTTSPAAPRPSSPTRRRCCGDAGEELSAEERSRRERSRESGAGLVDFTVDDTGRWATFALSGQAWAVHLAGRAVTALPTVGAVIDPRVDPTGRHVAYASGGALRVIGITGADDRALVEPESPTEVWGQAEFIAAEELDRFRGFWWAPDGESLLVERYDEAPVHVWHVADPAHPDRSPPPQRYPAAGHAQRDVTLWHVGLDGTRTEVAWDRDAFEYLVSVTWTAHGDPVLQVMSRDQRRAQVLSVDVDTGTTTRAARARRRRLGRGHQPAPVRRRRPAGDARGRRRHATGGRRRRRRQRPRRGRSAASSAPTPTAVLATASQEPTEVQVVRFGSTAAPSRSPPGRPCTAPSSAARPPSSRRSALDHPSTTITVHRDEAAPDHRRERAAAVRAGVTLLHAGPHALRTAVLFPRDHEPGSRRLPVLMDPYGGPHAQRVLASSRMFLEPQWLADQGFCVVVADGRGTPGRGPPWERAVRDDLAAVTLDDQVAALEAVAEQFPDDVDTSRVGITGWSFGGYLAALAVLRRPDVFHAAVAGAPVTEWRLYDTAYTERYLGDPNEQPDVYDRNSLLPLRREAGASAPAHPRPGRRQRLRRAHPAAVVGAARRRPAARGAAAVRRHAHDVAGGRGREPGPPPGRLPARESALSHIRFFRSSSRSTNASIRSRVRWGSPASAEIDEARVAALLTCGDALARGRHAFDDGVEHGHRAPLAVGVDEQVDPARDLVERRCRGTAGRRSRRGTRGRRSVGPGPAMSQSIIATKCPLWMIQL